MKACFRILIVVGLLAALYGCNRTPDADTGDRRANVPSTKLSSEDPQPGDSQEEPQLPEFDTSNLLAMDDLQAFARNPSDGDLFLSFVNANVKKFNQLREEEDVDEALKLVDAMTKVMEHYEQADGQVGQLANQMLAELEGAQAELIVMQMDLEDITAKIQQDPEDADAIKLLGTKLMLVVLGDMEDDPEQGIELIQEHSRLLAEAQERSESRTAMIAYSQTTGLLKQMAGRVLGRYEQLKLIGQEMTPITAEAWVNGDPLTPEDLQGKVVLLDFWAVWCGPCIMTFPSLVEWHENYHDQGLEIVGLTGYYDITWPEGDENPSQSDFPVEPEKEHQMLERVSKLHDLRHPTATLADDSSLREAYGQVGLPYMVLIGRDGKIAMIEEGISAKTAGKVEAKILELLAQPVPEPSETPAEEPMPEEPAPEEPTTEEPSPEEPMTEEPSSEEPATEEPPAEEPATEEPATEESPTEEPAAPEEEQEETEVGEPEAEESEEE